MSHEIVHIITSQLCIFVVFQDVVVPPASESVATFDHDGPRLMITHITNENFKSYAGIQELGPFHKVKYLLLYQGIVLLPQVEKIRCRNHGRYRSATIIMTL